MLVSVVELLESARRTAARSVNALMTTTYWLIGQRIVEQEQAGARHALYGSALLRQLSSDLTQRFGRGFSVDNLELMRLFYQAYPPAEISETSSRKSPLRAAPRLKAQTLELAAIAKRFPLSWSQYTLLVRRTRSSEARNFYEAEALRGGWTIRQLARQIDTQFYERTLLSRNKAAMLKKGQPAKPEDAVSPEEELKDPLVLEFLGLKDEYSEVELEEALIARLETFLLELGGDFAFVGRQRRLRIGDDWYRVDLLFFHRRLKALVIVDLKLGKLTHADAGQMHLYLNYARQHWTLPDENPPVGLILCADKNEALAHYALEGLPSKVLAAEYRTTLPPEAQLVAELTKTQHLLAERQQRRSHESAATAAAEPATSAS
ncbi:MAG TPA: PDDEXK nuclease domain-containing protein [Pseudomonadota bacterium]|nr:PDDEXK nuclease domain-containing protein [Pseudomonadota bacterium]